MCMRTSNHRDALARLVCFPLKQETPFLINTLAYVLRSLTHTHIAGEHGHSHGGGGHGHSHGVSTKKAKKSEVAGMTITDDVDAPNGSHGHGHAHAAKAHGHGHGEDSHDDHDCSSHADHGHGHGHGNAHAAPQPVHEHGQACDHEDDEDDHDNKKRAHGDLNMRAAWLHAMGDALGSIVVVVVGVTVEYVPHVLVCSCYLPHSLVVAVCATRHRVLVRVTRLFHPALPLTRAGLDGGCRYAEGDWRFYTDPCLTIVILLIITYSAIPLVRDCVKVLLQVCCVKI